MWDLVDKFDTSDPQVGRVIAARTAHAVGTNPPARSSVFAPVAWAASPGFAFPDTWDPAWDTLDLGPEANETTRARAMRGQYDEIPRAMRGHYIEGLLTDWSERPGALDSEDIAFGRPAGGSPMGALPRGEDPNDYHHLLQLSGGLQPSGEQRYEWSIGGDGGDMHWSIPTEALQAGDFSRAIPTPDIG
ncbi:hypothetical protein [Actinomadura alba]|uniref:DUF1963 domain-containing protein n=1 Tax=Actinomadura alba TaxID=406431 RepID=A0ABR7LPU1_9ACTN|nr:hypothetical protein [Actinomadura alba]MBC6466809.1 hypothetical protein [Actinomadura alba]